MRFMFKVLSFFLLIIIYSGSLFIISSNKNNLHLYIYSFNKDQNYWQIALEEKIDYESYIKTGLPKSINSNINLNNIFVAIKGHAIYYKFITTPDDTIEICFSDNSIDFYSIDWVGMPVTEIIIKLECYIPEIDGYISLQSTAPDKDAKIHFDNINSKYTYRIKFDGPAIEETEFLFSSIDDFPGHFLLEELKAICLIKKNSIYGSVLYDNIDYKPRKLIADLYSYRPSGGRQVMEKAYNPHNRFLFIVPEDDNSQEFLIIFQDDINNKPISYNFFVSKEPYILYFDIDNLFGVYGRVANNDISFPAKINVETHYYYESDKMAYPINNFNFSNTWHETDYNGYFTIPSSYPLSSEYLRNIEDYLEMEILYAELKLEVPESESVFLHRYYFDEKTLRELKKKPKLINIGDIFFEEGLELRGFVVNKDNYPVPDTKIYFSHIGNYASLARIMYDTEIRSGINSLFGTTKYVITDENGKFCITKKDAVIAGKYELYLYHESYVLTMYPIDITDESSDIGSLVIAQGNSITVNVITNEDIENIDVMLKAPGNTLKLELQSSENGYFIYYIDKIIPWDFYTIQLYNSGKLIDERHLIFEPHQRNTSETISFFLD